MVGQCGIKQGLARGQADVGSGRNEVVHKKDEKHHLQIGDEGHGSLCQCRENRVPAVDEHFDVDPDSHTDQDEWYKRHETWFVLADTICFLFSRFSFVQFFT